MKTTNFQLKDGRWVRAAFSKKPPRFFYFENVGYFLNSSGKVEIYEVSIEKWKAFLKEVGLAVQPLFVELINKTPEVPGYLMLVA